MVISCNLSPNTKDVDFEAYLDVGHNTCTRGMKLSLKKGTNLIFHSSLRGG